MLVFGEIELNGFGLKAIKYVSEAALYGLDLVVEGLLKVQKRSRCLPCTGVPKRADPDVGGVEVLQ